MNEPSAQKHRVRVAYAKGTRPPIIPPYGASRATESHHDWVLAKLDEHTKLNEQTYRVYLVCAVVQVVMAAVMLWKIFG